MKNSIEHQLQEHINSSFDAADQPAIYKILCAEKERRETIKRSKTGEMRSKLT